MLSSLYAAFHPLFISFSYRFVTFRTSIAFKRTGKQYAFQYIMFEHITRKITFTEYTVDAKHLRRCMTSHLMMVDLFNQGLTATICSGARTVHWFLNSNSGNNWLIYYQILDTLFYKQVEQDDNVLLVESLQSRTSANGPQNGPLAVPILSHMIP
jgi:hypothetical protein